MRSSNINTDALCAEIGSLVQNRLSELLADYEDRFCLYESVYNHIANLNLSRNTKSDATIVAIRNETISENNNEFYKLVLEQLGELKTEVQSLKNLSVSLSFKDHEEPITENISLVITDSSLETPEYCSEEEDREDSIKEALYEAMAVNQKADDEIVDEDVDDVSLDDAIKEALYEAMAANETTGDEIVDNVSVDEQTENAYIDEAEQEQVVDENNEEEEEYTEIEIDGISFCTNDESNGFIYEVDDDGGVGKKVGYIKNEEPFFY